METDLIRIHNYPANNKYLFRKVSISFSLMGNLIHGNGDASFKYHQKILTLFTDSIKSASDSMR